MTKIVVRKNIDLLRSASLRNNNSMNNNNNNNNNDDDDDDKVHWPFLRALVNTSPASQD